MQAPFKPTIRQGSRPYIFHVESQSQPRTFHTTDVLHLTCTCPAGRRGLRCWHLRWAIQAEGWYRRAAETARSRVAATVAAVQVPIHESAGYKALAACFG
jgi:hypothetical protein